MAQRGLSIAEALKVLEELPSDNESECTDRSNKTKEYDFDELSTLLMSMKAVVMMMMSRWMNHHYWDLKKSLQKILPDFTSKTGPSNELLELEENTQIVVFLTMFRDVLMDDIVF